MINISRKSGYALMLALVFVVVAAITSFGIYSYSEHIAREVRVDKKIDAKSYYYSIAGARYAMILLENPVTNFGFSTEAFNGEVKTIAITGSAAGTLGANLGFSGRDTLTITAREYNPALPASTPWDVNTYQIETSFTR